MERRGIIGSGFRHTICPYCLSAISLADCAVIDHDSGLVLWQPSSVQRALGRVWLRSLDNRRFRDVAAARQCADERCRTALPRNIDYARLCAIQVVSAPALDRSGFRERMHVLLQEQAALSRHDIGILPAQETQTRRRDGRPASRSQVYSLLLPDRGRQRSLNLVFHEQEAGIAPVLSGLIVMVDPSSLPGVLDRLPARQLPARPDPVGAVADLVREAARKSWRRRRRREGEPIPTPLSIVVCRPELLRQVGHALGLPAGVVTDDEAVNGQVDEFLSNLGGDPLVDAVRLFGRRAYHFLPSPNEGTADPPELKPLLWIFRQLGLLPAATAVAGT
jgi:hypothetical protein